LGDTTLSTFTSGFIIFKIQQFLKSLAVYRRFVEAFPGADKWAHRIIAGALSLVAASGIHYTLDGACSFSDGCHGTFSIPNGWTMLHGLWDWLQVYIVQQGSYDMTRTARPSSPPSTAHTIQEPLTDQTRKEDK
jgi:hypothetical protein